MNSWIVVVDDDMTCLANAKTILTAEGMRVSRLRSVHDLLKFMIKNTPDLILLDIMMPGMDGFQTYQALRRFEEEMGRKRTPVIFLTGSEDSETERRGLKEGASDFVRKPFDKDILIQRICNIVTNEKVIETLTDEASIDKLTGLLSRAAETKRLGEFCGKKDGMLMIVDLDSFKLVNDLHGHEMGDKVLKAFAAVVRYNTREEDVVARIGGDEFAAFCCGMKEESGLAALVPRLNEQFLEETTKLFEGIENITQLVVWGFSLLMLLVVIGALYLRRVQKQRQESEELQRAKDEAEKARGEAEKASQAKSEFLSNMSHEIRTPINAILGMNEVILRECEDNNILAYSENVRVAGNTLLGLVNDILDFSKIEAGKIEIIPVEYDLSSTLNDLVNMIHVRADGKVLEFIVDFDPETPKQLYGDEVRIKQVITNILTNAVKYTEKGSVKFSVGFKRFGEEPDSVLLYVAVADTGIGIKPEDMGKLFSKFERIEEKRNRNVEGTGLGMTITKRLLEKMDSSLHVESTYGVGSTFSFVLRQRVVQWEPLGDYTVSHHDAMMKNRKKYHEKFTAPEAQVLVVDDNPMNLMVFKSLLKQTKVRIDTANDGDEALSLMQGKFAYI